MGGMNLDNISTAKSLGFGGVVICGDLWNRFDIHNELDYKNLISHFEKLRKAVE
jgi:thiamine-phosphate pyrophosphorylase